MTLREWEEEEDRQLDEQLAALFRSVEPPAPRAGFVARTMRSVRQAPLPAGRQPLRRPWTVPIGWVVLVSAVASASFGAVVNQRALAEFVASSVSLSVRAAIGLVQSMRASSLMFDVLATTSRVVSHVLATREAAAGLVLMAFVAAISLSILNRLLYSEKEPLSW